MKKNRDFIKYGCVYVELVSMSEVCKDTIFLNWFIDGEFLETKPNDNILSTDVTIVDWDDFARLPVEIQKDFIECSLLFEKWHARNSHVSVVGILPSECKQITVPARSVEIKTFSSGDSVFVLLWDEGCVTVTCLRNCPAVNTQVTFHTLRGLERYASSEDLCDILEETKTFMEKFSLKFRGN